MELDNVCTELDELQRLMLDRYAKYIDRSSKEGFNPYYNPFKQLSHDEIERYRSLLMKDEIFVGIANQIAVE